MDAYYAYSNDQIRSHSSSGGLFSVIAEKFDVIYGVKFDDKFNRAIYSRETSESIKPLCGSKYLQAEVGNSLISVKRDLHNGLSVLFSGTPCQIAGLKTFLNASYDNLFCLEIVCHGVPSPKVWRNYKDLYERNTHTYIKNVNFRDKLFSWNDYGVLINNKYKSKNDDCYMRLFLNDYTLRPSCYGCQFKRTSFADLTIGDFWGISKIKPDIDERLGVSLVLSRTDKGKQLLLSISPKICIDSVNLDVALSFNPAIMNSPGIPLQRSDFFSELDKKNIDELADKYTPRDNKNLIHKIKRKIKIKIKQKIRGYNE